MSIGNKYVTFCCLFGASSYKNDENRIFASTADRLLKEAVDIGKLSGGTIYSVTDLPVDDEFIEYCRTNRGFGYWRWKPLVILSELDKVAQGDYVIYHDVSPYGYTIDRDLNPLIEFIDTQFNGMGLFEGSVLNRQWCKQDLFKIMNCNTPEYHSSYQLTAHCIIIKKTEANVKFIESWRDWMNHPAKVYDDEYRFFKPSEFPDYEENRHDQAVLTMLQIKNGIQPLKLSRFKAPYAERFLSNFIREYSCD